jgi:hypothetical protein
LPGQLHNHCHPGVFSLLDPVMCLQVHIIDPLSFCGLYLDSSFKYDFFEALKIMTAVSPPTWPVTRALACKRVA